MHHIRNLSLFLPPSSALTVSRPYHKPVASKEECIDCMRHSHSPRSSPTSTAAAADTQNSRRRCGAPHSAQVSHNPPQTPNPTPPTCTRCTANTNAIAYAVDTSASRCHTECQCLNSGCCWSDRSSNTKLARAGTATTTAQCHRRAWDGKRLHARRPKMTQPTTPLANTISNVVESYTAQRVQMHLANTRRWRFR